MATIILKLDKSDIKTTKYGFNYAVEAQGATVVFTEEAVDEFIRDVQDIRAKNANPSEPEPS